MIFPVVEKTQQRRRCLTAARREVCSGSPGWTAPEVAEAPEVSSRVEERNGADLRLFLVRMSREEEEEEGLGQLGFEYGQMGFEYNPVAFLLFMQESINAPAPPPSSGKRQNIPLLPQINQRLY